MCRTIAAFIACLVMAAECGAEDIIGTIKSIDAKKREVRLVDAGPGGLYQPLLTVDRNTEIKELAPNGFLPLRFEDLKVGDRVAAPLSAGRPAFYVIRIPPNPKK